MPQAFMKQPDEIKDYDFEWEDWLEDTEGDQIISYVMTTDDPGLVIASSQINLGATSVKVFLSAGVSGTQYKVTCTMTTQQGRVEQEEIYVYVQEL